jgi:hypothetical protein
MADTTIKVDSVVAAAMAYLREQVCPDFVESDARPGERFWRELEAGRSPASISEAAQVPRPRR